MEVHRGAPQLAVPSSRPHALPLLARTRGPPALGVRRQGARLQQPRSLLKTAIASSQQQTQAMFVEAPSTALLLAGVAPQQLGSSVATAQQDTPGPSRWSQRGARAAVAVSTASSAIPYTQNRSLFYPGIVLGALLMLAAQRVWVWARNLEWAQQVMDALDIRRTSSSTASTSSEGRMLPAPLRGRSPSRSPSPAPSRGWQGSMSGNVATYPIPDSPETRSLMTSLTDSLTSASSSTSSSLAQDQGESVEWVNMCWRKVWRVYQRGLERWITDLLQPVFDGVVTDGSVPKFVQRLRIVEFTLDHEAPCFTNMRRRYSRKDSDLTGVVDLRYTGGARMLLMLEVGGGRWRFKIPVLVSDLDIDCQMWIKIRLAPMCPWIGTLSVAFVGPPNVKVQLSPYNRVRLMRVPVVQSFLRKLLTVDLPGLMVLPKRLEVAIPPSVTSVAEAAVGRDTIMRAVASAVLQADAVEQALIAALPLGPQTAAGGISLPEAFVGEFDVVLREARDLPVWGFPGQSNPYVRMALGEQAVQSRRDDDTSSPGRHRHPVWNQEFQFLVEDAKNQTLEIQVRDSHLTGRVEVGSAKLPLKDIPLNGERVAMWLPLVPPPAYASRVAAGGRDTHGEVLLEVAYKAFDEEYDEKDSGYREAQTFQSTAQRTQQTPTADNGEERITDIRSAAAASSRAAVAASAALSAIAMTKAAAARAAMRAARAAQDAAASAVAAAGLPKSVSPQPQLPPPVATAMQQATEAAHAAAAAASPAAGDAATTLPAPPDAHLRPPSQADDITTHVGAMSDDEDGGYGPPPVAGRNGTGSGAVIAGSPATSSNGNMSSNGNGTPAAMRSVDAPGYDRLSHHFHTQHTAGYPVREPLPFAHGGKTHHAPAKPGVAGGKEHAVGAAPATAPTAAPTTGASNGAVIAPVPAPHSSSSNGNGKGHGLDSNTEAAVSTQLPTATTTSTTSTAPLMPVAAAAGSSERAVTPTQQPLQGATTTQHGVAGAPLPASDKAAAAAAAAAATAAAAAVTSSSIDNAVVDKGLSRLLSTVADTDDIPTVSATATVSTSHSLTHGVSTSSVGTSTGLVGSESSVGGGVVSGTGESGGTNGVALHTTDAAAASAQQQRQLAQAAMTADTASSTVTSTSAGTASTAEASSSSSSPASTNTNTSTNTTPNSADGSHNSDSWLGALAAAWSVLAGPHPPKPAAADDAAGGKSGESASSVTSTDSADRPTTPDSSRGSKPWWLFWDTGDTSVAEAASHAATLEDLHDRSNSGKSDSQADPTKTSKTGQSRPWWAIWGAGAPPATGEAGAPASEGGEQGTDADAAAQQQQQGGRPWWKFWGGGGEQKQGEGEGSVGSQQGGHDGNKPVEAIIIPPDLPLEEIAKEVAKLKDENWRSKEERMENIWAKAAQRNDRPWIILCAALLAIACVLLALDVAHWEQVMEMTGQTTGPTPEASLPIATLSLLLQLLR